MSCGAGPRTKNKMDHFHTEWEEDFLFLHDDIIKVCLPSQYQEGKPGKYDTEFQQKAS